MNGDQLRVLETVFTQDVLPTFLAGVVASVLFAIAVWKLCAAALRGLGELLRWIVRKTGVEAVLVRWERLIDLRILLMERRHREAGRAQ